MGCATYGLRPRQAGISSTVARHLLKMPSSGSGRRAADSRRDPDLPAAVRRELTDLRKELTSLRDLLQKASVPR